MELIGQIALEILGYFTAKLVLPVVSFGLLHVRRLSPSEERSCKWGMFFRDASGKIFLHPDLAGLFGLLVLGVLLGVGIYLHLW